MFLRLSLISFLFVSSVCAKELIVISRTSTFKVRYGENRVWLKGPQLELSLNKTDCNADILGAFSQRIGILLKTKPLSKSQGLQQFKFIVDGTEYFESYQSKAGYVLLTIPDEVQRMKIEEKVLCSK